MMADGDGGELSNVETGGSEPGEAEQLSDIDWAALHQSVFQYFETGYGRFARAIESITLDEMVQDAIVALYERSRDLARMPSFDEFELVAREIIRKRRAAAAKREQRRRHSMGAYAATLTASDLFDLLCKRDEETKYFIKIFERLERDPQARFLLKQALELQIDFSDSLALSDATGYCVRTVTKIKRRIATVAPKVSAEMSFQNPRGAKS